VADSRRNGVQNADAHNEGLGAIWKTRRAFWADRAVNECVLRANLLSLATTRTRHVGSAPNVERYAPDLRTDEFAFLSQPGQVDIQSDLFYDYRTNVNSYPKSQAWMRERQPRLLVIWVSMTPHSTFRSRKPINGIYRTLRFTLSTRGTSLLIPEQMKLLRS
jgi:hypothetical protein